ncbi:MAG: hypothetical protein JNM68_15015 [Dinghuibacter sp.]|nr:hypothetical protein [Dinghuibacter sp.]
MFLPDISQPDIQQTAITELDKLLNRMRRLAALMITAGNITSGSEQPVPANFTFAAEKAMAHAAWFSSRYFPETGNIVSSLVSGFNIIFQDRVGAICRVFENGSDWQQKPVGAKRMYIDGLLNELINHMEWEKEKADSMNRRLKAFSTQMGDDTINILAAVHREIDAHKDGNELFEIIDRVIRVQADNSHFNFNTQLLNGHPPVLSTAVLVKVVFLLLCESATAAQAKMQDVAASWAIMLRKYSALIAGLDNAVDEHYESTFQSTGMAASLQHWQNLAAIIPGNITP